MQHQLVNNWNEKNLYDQGLPNVILTPFVKSEEELLFIYHHSKIKWALIILDLDQTPKVTELATKVTAIIFVKRYLCYTGWWKYFRVVKGKSVHKSDHLTNVRAVRSWNQSRWACTKITLSLSQSCVTRKKSARKQWPREILRPSLIKKGIRETDRRRCCL